MITNEEKESWHYPAVKKAICIIEKNNFEIRWWFLLLELPSFF